MLIVQQAFTSCEKQGVIPNTRQSILIEITLLPGKWLKFVTFNSFTTGFFNNFLANLKIGGCMSKSQETWNKKEREKQKQKIRKEKMERREERKGNAKKGKSLEEMMAYVDENGNISSTPPDPRRKKEIKAVDIEIGVPKKIPVEPGDLIRTGTVTYFNDSKGFGFISDAENQQRVFVHINSCHDAIQEQSKVSFEIEMGARGASAVNVKCTG
jgi:cold shock CspA family protein